MTKEQWIEQEARKARDRYWSRMGDWDRQAEAHKQDWREVVAPFYQKPVADADTLEKLAEIGENAYNADKSNLIDEKWISATKAILRAAKPKVDVDTDDVAFRDALKKSQEIVNNWTPEQRNHNSIGYVGLQDNERAELENLRAECKRLRTQKPETRPVKVRFDLTAEDVWNTYLESGESYEKPLVDWILPFLATHAVIDVPPGVPTMEELVLIGRNAYQRALGFSEYKCYSDMSREAKEGDGAFVAAVRDAILSAMPQRREWTEQDVEELAGILRREAGWTETSWHETSLAFRESWRKQCRAALAWFDGKRGE